MKEDPHELIDRYLDSGLTPEETRILDKALRSEVVLRDEFRSRVRLHGMIARHFAWETSEESLPPLVEFPGRSREEKSSGLNQGWIAIAAAALVMMWLVTVVLFDRGERPVALGYFVSDNEVLDGRRYDLKDASIVEIRLHSGVEVVIESPASFQFRDATRLELFRGKLAAQVPKGAEGFTVITPEGEVIDRGTRFGVSVGEERVEAHVFEGEVEVRSPRQSGSVRLLDSEALDLVANKTGVSDSSSFPMPGFTLPISLNDPGLESGADFTQGIPTVFGCWGGDESRVVTDWSDPGQPEVKVHPAEGDGMIQFIGTSASPEFPRGRASELWQILDLTPFSDEVNRGGVEAILSARFNRIPGSSRNDRKFGIALYAFQGSVELAVAHWDQRHEPLSEQLAQVNVTLDSDDDASTWEPLKCDFLIPPNTDYLVAQLCAFEDKSDDETLEFEGHFADDSELVLKTRVRSSFPVATWAGDTGNWHEAGNWAADVVPDGAREGIRVTDADELCIDRRVQLKQTLWLAHGKGKTRVRILPNGILERSGTGELLLGYNEGGEAELIVEGLLRTRGRVFIGRNNAESRLVVDGGRWDSSHGIIRMSQYGNRGPDTLSALEVRRDGRVNAERIEMIHDRATVLIESGGYLEVERLRVGGDNGEARVIIREGRVRVQEVEFGPVEDSAVEMGVGAVLELKGEWDELGLKNLPGARWIFDERPTVEWFDAEGETWTRILVR